MAAFFGVIHKDQGSAYGISWPDLPGCVSAADTLEELDAMAREALALHLEGMREDGEALPAPSGYADVLAAHEGDDDFFGVLLVSIPDEIKRARVQLRVSEIDLAVIDRAAEAQGLDRTAFMVSAAKRAAKGEALR